jgi:hypothetical protein
MSREHWGTLPIVIGILMLGSACGRSPYVGPLASAARSATTTTAPPTAAPPIDTTSWKSYSSAKWGYTFRYPSQWYELGNLGAPDTEEYLSNEKVASPTSLSPTGVFVAISIHSSSSSSDCTRHGVPTDPTVIDRTEPISIDGAATNLYAIGGGEPYFELNAMKGQYCHMLSFVFRTVSVRDSTEPIVQSLVATFRFGSPTAPAP